MGIPSECWLNLLDGVVVEPDEERFVVKELPERDDREAFPLSVSVFPGQGWSREPVPDCELLTDALFD